MTIGGGAHSGSPNYQSYYQVNGTQDKICYPQGDKTLVEFIILSRLTVVSHEAKKKQTVRDEQVSYLQVAPP